LLIIGAVVAGSHLFIPSWSLHARLQKLTAAVHERSSSATRSGKEAEIKKKNEEEGIVYFGPAALPSRSGPFRENLLTTRRRPNSDQEPFSDIRRARTAHRCRDLTRLDLPP